MNLSHGRCLPTAAALALAGLSLFASPGLAVIMKLISLKSVIEETQLIFVATIDKLDPEKPSAVFKVEKNLKGEVTFETLPVNMTGDAEAKKDNHTKQIFDRLDPSRKAVVFATRDGKKYNAMVFVEGTWFSLQGSTDADGKTVRWAFLHAEPYLRRTFKGTTAEMLKAVEDGLAKKAETPPVDKNEKPGLGPAVEKKTPQQSMVSPFTPALFGVIPSFVLIGPLAVIAALFPGVFARLAVLMKRWRAFLTIASTNSTLAFVYWLLREYNLLPASGLFSLTGFTICLLVVTFAGLVWAGRRYQAMAAQDPAVTDPPGRREVLMLAALTVVVGLVALGTAWFAGNSDAAFALPLREFTFIGFGLLAATCYAGYRSGIPAADRLPDGSIPPVRLSVSGEMVGLGVLFLCGLCTVLLSSSGSRKLALGTEVGDQSVAIGHASNRSRSLRRRMRIK